MGDNPAPDCLVERLHLLRARSGLTTQQMATRCGLPKSTMESYLRLKNPKRPGVDAMIAIAGAMGVSLDWLVGRIGDDQQPTLHQRDYALGCFNTIMELLQWLRVEYTKNPNTLFEDGKIAGRDEAEIAAKGMAVFTEAMHSYAASSDRWGPTRSDLHESLRTQLEQPETENS